MKLKKGDELISMDILPSRIVSTLATVEDDADIDEDMDMDNEAEEAITPDSNPGPWLLAITNGGYGKRVPVKQFRLQNRAGQGIKAIKFRAKDQLTALRIVNEGDELMIVTNRGIIIRQAVEAISLQSRMATGVRVQRLDKDDAIAAVALVPPAAESEAEEEDSEVET